MGKNNQQRRAASNRRRQRRSGGGAAPPRQSRTSFSRSSGEPPPPIEDLLLAAAWSWGTDAARDESLIDALAGRERQALVALDGLLRDAVGELWRRGWTPSDLVHVVSRRLSAAHGDLAAEQVVADGRSRTQRGQEPHPRWEAQLAVLAQRGGMPASLPLGTDRLRLGLAVLCAVKRLPSLPRVMPAPGEAGGAGGASHASAGLDERVLGRVRALLSKAESTAFDEEAEALTAKAQELIARYAIDDALLHAADDVGEPWLRRVLVHDPYADAKASLLTKVGAANRCRVVYTADCGWVTVFGYDADLDAVELLATSLLAQAANTMARHGRRRDASGRSRTRSFRRSFLLGFAHRIGQRLRDVTDGQVEAAAHAERGRLLPVLSAREDRLRAAQEAAFPDVVRKSSAASNAGGWAAGQAAADLADLDVSAGTLRRT